MKKKDIIRGTARTGHKIKINTSKKECEKWKGVEHGSQITVYGCITIRCFVVGVGPQVNCKDIINNGKKVLWLSKKKNATDNLFYTNHINCFSKD